MNNQRWIQVTRFSLVSVFLSFIVFLYTLVISGCATEEISKVDETDSSIVRQISEPPPVIPPYQGPRLKVMVFPWNISRVDLNKYPHFQSEQIGFGISNRLLEMLFDTGRFELIEQKQLVLARMVEQMQQCSSGQNCGKAGYGLHSADYIVYPEVYQVGIERQVNVKGLKSSVRQSTEIGIQIVFINAKTGVTETLGSYVGSYPSSSKTSILTNGNLVYSQSALGKAAYKAIYGALAKALKRMQMPAQTGSYTVTTSINPQRTDNNVGLYDISSQTLARRKTARQSNNNHTIDRSTGSSFSSSQAASMGITGEYHAFIIGNNKYRFINPLVTAVNDAQSVEQLLRTEYGYRTHMILDGTRQDIIREFDKLRAQLSEQDKLLIYYAGHGFLDQAANRGYWLPVNATEETTAEWISNADITDKVKAIKARQVIVVADSCYSGTLTRGLNVALGQQQSTPDYSYYKRMLAKRSRTVMASGGLEPVADGGGNGHSVFAQSFLNVLEDNQGIIDGTEFFNKVRHQVILAADQTPEYADIRLAGHEGGDFLFIKQ